MCQASSSKSPTATCQEISRGKFAALGFRDKNFQLTAFHVCLVQAMVFGSQGLNVAFHPTVFVFFLFCGRACWTSAWRDLE